MKRIKYETIYPALDNYYTRNKYQALADNDFWLTVLEESGIKGECADNYLIDPIYIKDETKFILFMLKYGT